MTHGPDDRLRRLIRIYDEIHAYAEARDPGLARREIVPRALDSQVLLVGQALGRDTQRLSGLPYVRPDGTLSRGGRTLDRFLDGFGHTIDPRGEPRSYAYHTDLIPWFPGRRTKGSGDVVPTEEEIKQCRHWLEVEFSLVNPRAVVALGLPAARELLGQYGTAELPPKAPLAELACRAHLGVVLGTEVPIFVVHHPSGAFQHPTAESIYQATAQQIRRLLGDARS